VDKSLAKGQCHTNIHAVAVPYHPATPQRLDALHLRLLKNFRGKVSMRCCTISPRCLPNVSAAPERMAGRAYSMDVTALARMTSTSRLLRFILLLHSSLARAPPNRG
jgi:hypothetical protein